MKLLSLEDVYREQLRDMHSCEKQLTKAIPKMAKAAQDPALRKAFTDHLKQTEGHLDRLAKILDSLGVSAGRKVCQATVGLIEEGSEVIEADGNPAARDAALICAAQKIEHYEIASYGCLHTYATTLGRDADASILAKTLAEEGKANDSLTALAIESINAQSMQTETAE